MQQCAMAHSDKMLVESQSASTKSCRYAINTTAHKLTSTVVHSAPTIAQQSLATHHQTVPIAKRNSVHDANGDNALRQKGGSPFLDPRAGLY